MKKVTTDEFVAFLTEAVKLPPEKKAQLLAEALRLKAEQDKRLA